MNRSEPEYSVGKIFDFVAASGRFGRLRFAVWVDCMVSPFGMNCVAGSPQFIVRINNFFANSGKFGAHVQRSTCNWLP